MLAVTCQRNDGPYLLEWVAHHLAAGFDHVLVFSHDCDDGSDGLLDALAKTGRVSHVHFTPEGERSVQWQAMKLADRHPLVKAASWMMFFDCDEFLCLTPPLTSVQDLIQDTQADAIPLRWRFFGHNGQVDWSEGITPDRFTRAAPRDVTLPAGHFFKTLFRPSAFQKTGVHRPKSRKGETPLWMQAGGAPLPTVFAGDDQRINLFGIPTGPEKAWLNHYSVRSASEFLLKQLRGLPNRSDKALDLGYWAERNFNTEAATEILPMLPATKAVMADLLGNPAVAQAQAATIAHHKARLAALLDDPAAARRLWHMVLLAGSTPPHPDQTRAHLERLAQARDKARD